MDWNKFGVPNEVLEYGERAAARYVDWCEKNGGPPSPGFQTDLAIMYARQQACGSKNTDRAFMEGQQNGEAFASMHPGVAKKLARRYKQMTGQSLPQGATYNSQVARFPCDPAAVVSSIGELKQRAIATGKAYEDVGIKAVETPPPNLNRKKLGGMLLRRRLKKELRKPENKGKHPRELVEKIVDKHGYNAHE